MLSVETVLRGSISFQSCLSRDLKCEVSRAWPDFIFCRRDCFPASVPPGLRGHRGFQSSRFYFRLNKDFATQVETNEPVVVVQGNDLADAVVGQYQSGEFLDVSKVGDYFKHVSICVSHTLPKSRVLMLGNMSN